MIYASVLKKIMNIFIRIKHLIFSLSFCYTKSFIIIKKIRFFRKPYFQKFSKAVAWSNDISQECKFHEVSLKFTPQLIPLDRDLKTFVNNKNLTFTNKHFVCYNNSFCITKTSKSENLII